MSNILGQAHNAGVGGSSPPIATNIINELAYILSYISIGKLLDGALVVQAF